MISKLVIAACLAALCVAIHATCIGLSMRWLRERLHSTSGHFSVIWLLILLAGWIVIFHLIEVMTWGLVYYGTGAVPEFENAMYFSAVTYTTTGYGDVLLPKEWRLVCAVESLTGILMCGWSTGFFFNAVSRIYDFDEAQSDEDAV